MDPNILLLKYVNLYCFLRVGAAKSYVSASVRINDNVILILWRAQVKHNIKRAL